MRLFEQAALEGTTMALAAPPEQETLEKFFAGQARLVMRAGLEQRSGVALEASGVARLWWEEGCVHESGDLAPLVVPDNSALVEYEIPESRREIIEGVLAGRPAPPPVLAPDYERLGVCVIAPEPGCFWAGEGGDVFGRVTRGVPGIRRLLHVVLFGRRGYPGAPVELACRLLVGLGARDELMGAPVLGHPARGAYESRRKRSTEGPAGPSAGRSSAGMLPEAEPEGKERPRTDPGYGVFWEMQQRICVGLVGPALLALSIAGCENVELTDEREGEDFGEYGRLRYSRLTMGGEDVRFGIFVYAPGPCGSGGPAGALWIPAGGENLGGGVDG